MRKILLRLPGTRRSNTCRSGKAREAKPDMSRLRSKALGDFARLEHSPFGDDRGHVIGRGDVESGIENIHTGWSDGMTAVDGRDFLRIALLDRDLIP